MNIRIILLFSILCLVTSCVSTTSYTKKDQINEAVYYTSDEKPETMIVLRSVGWKSFPANEKDSDEMNASENIEESLYGKEVPIIGFTRERYDLHNYFNPRGAFYPKYYIADAGTQYLFISENSVNNLKKVIERNKTVQMFKNKLIELNKQQPSDKVLQSYSLITKKAISTQLSKGDKIHIEVIIQNLSLGGNSLSKANSFQFYANPIYSEYAGDIDLLKFLVYGQSMIIVGLLNFYQYQTIMNASVYGTVMDNAITPLVRADYMSIKLPDQDDVIIKIDNQDVSAKDMGLK